MRFLISRRLCSFELSFTSSLPIPHHSALKTSYAILVCALCSLSAIAQKTGVKGQLYWLAPETNYKPNAQTIPYNGVPLEIFIHELTSKAEVDIENNGIKKIYTPAVARIFSDWDGSFKAKLPPGRYSVFVRYQNSFFGNITDAEGNLSPVIVSDKGQAWITINIDYASYH